MTDKDFIVFGSPRIDREEIDEVVRCLESGWIGTGPRVTQFESEFAAYKQASYAAALASCTAAMHLSVLAAGIGEGDEVITTPLTFCATVILVPLSAASKPAMRWVALEAVREPTRIATLPLPPSTCLIAVPAWKPAV